MAIALDIDPNRRVAVRVVDDDGQPSSWAIESFDVVDPQLPPNWCVSLDEAGYVSFAPCSWLTDGFWEKVFDRDDEALTQFHRELSRFGGYNE